jgi:membrane associated rhomboid family serine protease
MIPIRDSLISDRAPIVVYALIAINLAVFLYQIGLNESQARAFAMIYGLVPLRYTEPLWGLRAGLPPDDYAPFLTSMFLHGGWLHIILNMWTLFIFGRSLEGYLGPVRFLLFYLASGVAAALVHFYFNLDSALPVVGASGAIAGVIGAYTATFPCAKVTLLFPIIVIPLIFNVPALSFALVWFALQVMQGASDLMTPSIGGGIAWWAHIGGFLAGLALLPVMLLFGAGGAVREAEWARPQPPPEPEPPREDDPPYPKGPWG